MVLEPARDSDDPRPLVLTENRWAGRISSADYSGASARLGSMTLPKRVEHRQPRVRRDVASALRSATAGLDVPRTRGKRSGQPQDPDVDPELADLREQLVRHRAHGLGDREEKVRLAERYLRIERDNAQTQQKVVAATNSLARTFDRIVVLLTERGFIQDTDGDPGVTDDGRLLARIYSESDLLVAECLRGGRVGGPGARGAGGACCRRCSTNPAATHPAQRRPPIFRLPSCVARWPTHAGSPTELRADEQRHRISPSREPDEGFVTAVYRWATTGDLAAALDASDVGRRTASPLSAGDFVRWCRQVLDLLDQVRNAAPAPELRAAAKRAINDIRRGVVAVDAGKVLANATVDQANGTIRERR